MILRKKKTILTYEVFLLNLGGIKMKIKNVLYS